RDAGYVGIGEHELLGGKRGEPGIVGAGAQRARDDQNFRGRHWVPDSKSGDGRETTPRGSNPATTWPGLSRPSTSSCWAKAVDAGHKPGMTNSKDELEL